jgi:hypothetical protein
VRANASQRDRRRSASRSARNRATSVVTVHTNYHTQSYCIRLWYCYSLLVTASTSLRVLLASVTEGDLLTITFGKNEVRKVVVTGTKSIDGQLRYIWTTSGRVRPGHRDGGSLSIALDGLVSFQPTIQQQAKTVLSVDVTSPEVVVSV